MNQTEIEVNVSDVILTPFASATLINEILKGLLFQKCQIPYPYIWLKSVVEKRRDKVNSGENIGQRVNYKYENHYRLVSTAYDTLNLIMEGIEKEFCKDNGLITDIILLFGRTPNCPNEIFTIKLPLLRRGHNEKNHIGHLNKILQKVLRNIFLSQTWIDSIDASISCTNTFVYIKKQVCTEISTQEIDSEAFETCNPIEVSPNIKHFSLHISCNPREKHDCGCEFSIFDEGTNVKHEEDKDSESNVKNIVWYRSKTLLKGFKDSFVDKVSICELW